MKKVSFGNALIGALITLYGFMFVLLWALVLAVAPVALLKLCALVLAM